MAKPRLFVEVGQRIGAGVIVETGLYVPRKNGSPWRAARLHCDCGNDYVLPIHELVGQKRPRLSCGCMTKELQVAALARAREVMYGQHGSGFVDRTGQRYGSLVVIGLGPPAVGASSNCSKVRWLCRCDCGNEKLARAECLSKGITRSCGCQRILRLPPGTAARNRTIKGYKEGARTRGLSWELTDEDFDRLTSQDCFYCGSEPSTVTAGMGGAGSFTYNGIDRKDNTVGYVSGNVVPCCVICNRAKMAMPYDDFLAWIGRLTAHQMFSPESLPTSLLKKAS